MCVMTERRILLRRDKKGREREELSAANSGTAQQRAKSEASLCVLLVLSAVSSLCAVCCVLCAAVLVLLPHQTSQ
jgi:hypothetical protein